MFISCPLCKTRFRFDEQKVRIDGIKLRCSKCAAIFKLAADREARGGRLTVLVAHESAEFCAAVEKVLASEPFDIISSHDGKEALDLVFRFKPDVVLLNVALPTMYGFQVCEALRGNPETRTIRIILLAAIYDKTKYKRSPQSLYGADDYIEQHHIPDALAAMIYRLAADIREVEPDSIPEPDELSTLPDRLTPAEASRQESVRMELMSPAPQEEPGADETAYKAAKQLARSIVSDISLYREVELEEAIRTDSLELCLGLEIKDGRAIYEKRLPDFASFPRDFYADALAELISQKKRELKIDEG
jgi:predicted Zn finger-like uncharacterized protein